MLLLFISKMGNHATVIIAEKGSFMFFVQIQVRCKDGSELLINSFKLEEMIMSGEISHFRRSHGWVDAASAETRETSLRTYTGNERRRDILSRKSVFKSSRNQVHTRPKLSVSDLVTLYWRMLRGESSYR